MVRRRGRHNLQAVGFGQKNIEKKVVTTFVLVIIYVSFIALGLPDSLLGASWPLMRVDLGADMSLLGAVSLTTCLGTVAASISHARISRVVRPGVLNCACTFLTAFCLMAISRITTIRAMFPVALLLGLGAGSVDSALNNYVALHFKARHMSFLHACWGAGTIAGPTLLCSLFRAGRSWRGAYRAVSLVQAGIALALLLTLGLWRKASTEAGGGEEGRPRPSTLGEVLRIEGVGTAAFSTFLYCSIESTTFVWTASFLTASRGLAEAPAALAVSMLYWGITLGRVATGLAADRWGDDAMVGAGLAATLAAGAGLLLGRGVPAIMASAFFIGFGFGPVFPSILHQTPGRFGAAASDAITGLLMAGAYTGSALAPLLFGLAARTLGLGLLPEAIVASAVLQMGALHARKAQMRRAEGA